jgi:hypothetical protein
LSGRRQPDRVRLHGVEFYRLIEGNPHERAARSYEALQPRLKATGTRFRFRGVEVI